MASFSVAGEKLLHQAAQAEEKGNRALAEELRARAEQVNFRIGLWRGL